MLKEVHRISHQAKGSKTSLCSFNESKRNSSGSRPSKIPSSKARSKEESEEFREAKNKGSLDKGVEDEAVCFGGPGVSTCGDQRVAMSFRSIEFTERRERERKVMLTSSPAASPAPPQLIARLDAKRQELSDLHDVRDLSEQLLAYFDEFGRHLDELNRGSEAIAKVMSNWEVVFRMAEFVRGLPSSNADAEDNNKTGQAELVQISQAQ